VPWDGERLILDFYFRAPMRCIRQRSSWFTEEADGTLVVVEHRPKAESAALWAAGAPLFERNWGLVLPALQEASR
jgi:hypothetical protein